MLLGPRYLLLAGMVAGFAGIAGAESQHKVAGEAALQHGVAKAEKPAHAPNPMGQVAPGAEDSSASSHSMPREYSVADRDSLPKSEMTDSSPEKAAKRVMPSWIDFTAMHADSFLKQRRSLVATMDSGDPKIPVSQGDMDRFLDLATLYLSYGMITEGRSLLAALEDDHGTPEQMARRAGLSITLNVVDPLDGVLSDQEEALLKGDDPWPNQSVLRAIYYIKSGDQKTAGLYLGDAAIELLGFSDDLNELVLPELLETAINLHYWGDAKALAKIFTEIPHLKNSTAYQYLWGKMADYGKDYLAAFDNYSQAISGDDIWAQKARLSLIQMGLKTETLSVPDAHVLLEQVRNMWFGDALELKTLNLLIRVDLALHNRVDALEVLGKIIYDRMDKKSTRAAKEQADELLKSYYEDGAAGKINISEFMEGHQRIAADYRFEKGFGGFAEKFADRLFSIGATNEAAHEYETTYNYLAVAQDLGLFEIPDVRLDRLRLKEAKAYVRGGQFEEAMPILALGPESDEPEIKDAFTLLKTELYDQIGDSEAILNVDVVKPSVEYLLIKAEAYFSLEDWKNASRTYDELWDRLGDKFTFTDASNMLLAAYREKDINLALKLVKLFPDLTDVPQWHEIAAGLFEERDIGDTLRNDDITSNLSDAERTLDVMQFVNSPSQ